MCTYGVDEDVCLDRRLTESDLATDLHVGNALFAHEAVDEALLNAEASCRGFFVDERIRVEELLLFGVSHRHLRYRAGTGGDAGRGHALELTVLGAGVAHPRHHLVAVHDDVLEVHAQVFAG